MNKHIGIAILTAATLLLGACKSTTYNTSVRKETPADAAKYNALLGVEYLKRGELAKAKEKIERSLKYDDKVPVTHTAAAMLYDRLGEYDKADSHFRSAIRLQPDDAELTNHYGVFLCSRGRIAEGEQNILKAAKNPLYAGPFVAYTNAGICMVGAGRGDEAEKYFQQALTLRPKFPRALAELANLNFKRNRYPETHAYIERYMSATKMLVAPDPEMADMLWIGVQVEKALNNPSVAGIYAKRLKTEYPRTEQTRALLKSERPAG